MERRPTRAKVAASPPPCTTRIHREVDECVPLSELEYENCCQERGLAGVYIVRKSDVLNEKIQCVETRAFHGNDGGCEQAQHNADKVLNQSFMVQHILWAGFNQHGFVVDSHL